MIEHIKKTTGHVKSGRLCRFFYFSSIKGRKTVKPFYIKLSSIPPLFEADSHLWCVLFFYMEQELLFFTIKSSLAIFKQLSIGMVSSNENSNMF